MTTMKISVVAVLALMASGAPAVAQSPLADAARREAARREAIRAASIPVYTNEDLSRLPARPAPPQPVPVSPTRVTTLGPGGDTPEAAAAAGETPAAPAAPARGTEEQWRTRITTARTNLARARTFAEALQSRVNALSTDYVNRDDPAQRQQISEDRQKALEEMARVQAEIAAFEKEIADILDEARRLNVPPGWLR